MRYKITLLDIVRGRAVVYTGYEFADDDSAADFGRHRAMLEFGPGPYEREEIRFSTQRDLDYKPFGEQISTPVLRSYTPMTVEERAAFEAAYTHEQSNLQPPLGGMTAEQHAKAQLDKEADASYVRPNLEDVGAGSYCPRCGKPQFNTPSGIRCDNGHGAPD